MGHTRLNFLNGECTIFLLIADKDATFVDAPVSGGVLAANAGTLTFMVGANQPSDFEKAKAVLMDMGKNVTHCGKVGSGGAVKICNNSKYLKAIKGEILVKSSLRIRFLVDIQAYIENLILFQCYLQSQ